VRRVVAFLIVLAGGSALAAQEVKPGVRASHEKLEPGTQVDEYGIRVPVPASHPGRRFPADEGFPTGPSVGETLPSFRLPNQRGEMIDFHEDRAGRRAVVMFQRSAVW
jgi:hypothetical protein